MKKLEQKKKEGEKEGKMCLKRGNGDKKRDKRGDKGIIKRKRRRRGMGKIEEKLRK